MNILDKAQKILSQPVCDHCLGRQFGQLLSGYSNDERGRLFRTITAMSIDKEDYKGDIDFSNFAGYSFHNLELKEKAKPKVCSVCSNLFQKLPSWIKKIESKSRKYEFNTFLVGTKLSSFLIENEEDLWERVGIDYCEPIKAEINREVGKLIEKKLGARFNPKNPEINIILDFDSGNVIIEVNPLFIYGEYQKLIRGIPQTKWPSKKYKTSVEQIIAKPYMAATRGSAHSFHGCISGDTKILLNECCLPISELEKNWKKHDVVTLNEKKKRIEISKIKDFMKAELETFRLRTKETGREIIASKEHPFYTPHGMVSLANLKVGDLVAVNPVQPLTYLQPPENVVIDVYKILKTIENYIPTSNKQKIIKELKERNLLPIKTNSENILILTRILAFLFGDGNVRYDGKRDVGLEFYGAKEDLKEIQSDLKGMKFNSSIFKSKGRKSASKDYYGNEKIIEGEGGFRLLCYSKSLWTLLVTLDTPVGNKTTKDFVMPDWIKESGTEIKREFLSSLFGCEMDMPRLDKRKYNKKSFNTPRFSMNKIEAKVDNMTKFMNDIKEILSEFDVRTLKIRLVPYTTRKDGNKSIKVILDIKNNFENLINLYKNINFRYCKEKELYSKYVLEYLLMKKYVVDRRKEIYNKALELKKKGMTLSQIHKFVDSKYLNKKDLWLWIHEKIKPENIKVPNDFPDFDVWLKTASKDLNDSLVWETVESIEKVGKTIVYDLTVPKNHNFFANGFLVSNCGREDIDARCLAWRPFVLEITKPCARKINLKKLAKQIRKGINVRQLRFSNINEVRRIKEAKVDKTYRAIVECRGNVNKSDLKKLRALATTIYQRTPERVLHRRADKARKRAVRSVAVKYISPKKFLLTIRSEGGLYVKELVTGDEGRTRPSVSELLGTKCTCRDLDVVKIHVKK